MLGSPSLFPFTHTAVPSVQYLLHRSRTVLWNCVNVLLFDIALTEILTHCPSYNKILQNIPGNLHSLYGVDREYGDENAVAEPPFCHY